MLVECGGDELSVTVFNFRPADMKLVYQDASQGDADGMGSNPGRSVRNMIKVKNKY